MGQPVIVLFEDARAPTTKSALDDLLVSCVADTLGFDDRFGLRRWIQVSLRKGNANLLDDCRRVGDIAKRGELVVAVFDNDEVRKLLGMRPKATATQVEAAIKKNCPNPTRLRVVLLDRNMESPLRGARACGVDAPEDLWASAVEKKRLNARDQILKKLAFGARALRDCVRKRLPSFEQLVSIAAESIQ
jgi:hypothetical protein